MKNDTPAPQSSIKRMRAAFTTQRYPSNEYKAIFEILLFGSFALVAILSVLLFISYFALNNTYVIGRILICAAALLYLAATYVAWAHKRYAGASQLLVLFYYIIAAIIIFGWGVGTTFSHLMLAITIVLAGILLGNRAVVITAGLSIATMLLAQAAITVQKVPWFENTVRMPTSFGDVLGLCALLGVLALISALFGKRTQAIHAQDQRAKELLAKEKGTLELSVRKHSEQLKTMQLEEMEQLYKFAEMGQLSAVLMHDIAGHMTTLNLDIADLKRDRQHSKAVKHVEESIDYIEQAINQARQHLQIKDTEHRFDVLDCIEDSIKLPRFQKIKPYIKVIAPERRVFLFGQPLRLSHMLVILIRNAVEAYAEGTPLHNRIVTVALSDTKNAVVIKVTDKGTGISEAIRKRLFTPLRSAKKDGLGVGLYIAKKIAETHFNGTLELAAHTSYTEFILTIPKYHAE